MSQIAAASHEQQAVSSRLLIALDDDPASAELVARVGDGCGYETHSFSDPREAESMLRQRRPDVITLDLSMPETNGFQLLPLLQEIGFKGALIVISGNESWMRQFACELADLRGVAMATHMQKPIDIRALKDLLIAVHLVID